MTDVSGHNCLGRAATSFTVEKPSTPTVRRDYSCKICGLSFTTVLALCEHEKTHKAGDEKLQKYVPCRICRLMLPSREKLCEHMISHLMFYCLGCKKSFSSKDEMEKHFVMNAKFHNDFCMTCGIIFSTKELRDSHLLQVHGGEDVSRHVAMRVQYVCACCNQDLSDTKAFAEHKATHIMEVTEESLGAAESEGKILKAIFFLFEISLKAFMRHYVMLLRWKNFDF
jgi:hypothetical protein